MGTLQRVRFKPSSRVARYWEIAPEAVGALMCSYRMPRCCSANHDRVDVRFRPDRVIWGVPATELDLVAESAEPPDASAPKSQA